MIFSAVILVSGTIAFNLFTKYLLVMFSATDELLGFGIPGLKILSL